MIVPARTPSNGEQRFRLSGVTWAGYVAIGNAIGECPIRLTYDRGELEFMTTPREHERSKSILGRLVEAVTEEMDIDIAAGGSMTFQREDLDRGMEPDECYWIQSESLVRGKDNLDLYRDPPPDLALEAEVSRSLLDRMGILAALRVPEVWRYDGEKVHVHLLGPDGKYVESDRSRVFPFLPVHELARFIQMRSTMSDTAIIRAFREWVREHKAEWLRTGTSS